MFEAASTSCHVPFFVLYCCYTICVTAHRIHTFIPLSVIKLSADSIDCNILTGMITYDHQVQFGIFAICNCAHSLSSTIDQILSAA